MGKMHDRFKNQARKDYIVPQATHIAGATVIQQLGLDTPDGLQRMCMILLTKLDPESKGVTITLEDLNHSVHVQLVEGRKHWVVRGQNDQILMRMCTAEEVQQHREFEESKAPPQQ